MSGGFGGYRPSGTYAANYHGVSRMPVHTGGYPQGTGHGRVTPAGKAGPGRVVTGRTSPNGKGTTGRQTKQRTQGRTDSARNSNAGRVVNRRKTDAGRVAKGSRRAAGRRSRDARLARRNPRLTAAERATLARIYRRLAAVIENRLLLNALNRLAAGVLLTPAEVGCVRQYLTSSDCALSEDEVALVEEGLAGVEEVTSAEETIDDQAADDADEDGQDDVQYWRYLKVKNDTDERVTLWVQYRTLDEQDGWAWYPADPTQSRQAKRFVLEPGEETYLDDRGSYLGASRVRIWAKAADGDEWLEFKGHDLWLVEEVDDEGEHHYLADEPETYTFTIR
jgi:hypothetical protein